MGPDEAKELLGCCGLYCGLCSHYQSTAPSRCLGCVQGPQHAYCSIWNCCARKRGYATCAECGELFTCVIHSRRKVADWVPAADNLRLIQEAGVDVCLQEQIARQSLLEELLRGFNEGRSMSYYCTVCARLPVDQIAGAIDEAQASLAAAGVDPSDLKSRARVMKAILAGRAAAAGVGL